MGNNPQKIQIYGAVLSLYINRLIKQVNKKGGIKSSLLLQSKYPFTSVNMNNLVPMGTECNRNYKATKDVIYGSNVRALYYSPFAIHYPISISLVGSVPPNDFKSNGNWIVEILPDNDYTRRWDQIFSIKRRYAEQMLNGCYTDWMKDFKIYVIKNGLPTTAAQLRTKFKDMGKMLLENPLSEPNLVKGAFYSFLGSYRNIPYNAAVLKYLHS